MPCPIPFGTVAEKRRCLQLEPVLVEVDAHPMLSLARDPSFGQFAMVMGEELSWNGPVELRFCGLSGRLAATVKHVSRAKGCEK